MKHNNKNKSGYRRVNGGYTEEEKEGYKYAWFVWVGVYIFCICCIGIAVLVIVSILISRDNNDDDDDGAVKLSVEQSASLNSIVGLLGNLLQTDDFTRCLSGCGVGIPTRCTIPTPDCLDLEDCRSFCGRPSANNRCINSTDCNGNKLCERFCFRRIEQQQQKEKCVRDCICETKVDR